MSKPETTGGGKAAGMSLGQLEAGYLAYCKALRLLVQEGHSLNAIKRTLCWQRLEMLHHVLPRQYRDPVMHYGMVKRAFEAEVAGRS
jgi:hypothetical protein